MRFTLATALAAAVTAIRAAPSASNADGAIHKVMVNSDGFEPSNVNAAVGDFVEFHFAEGHNSVVQSSYDKPCQDLSNGFSSATFIVDVKHVEGTHVFVVPVTSTDSVWFYNGAWNQCYKYGAVGVINQVPDGIQNVKDLSSKARRVKNTSNPHIVHGGVIKANPNIRPEWNNI
ncbi:uncharacterized protein BROUX77_004222 [Berkeleyomyces rouxiae]|uniref:uncharacterized protein n=1 Tax=Berkeleyomyces rouxiae TaxID=2035830 RepID=UPI003B789904